eukprot:m.27139 g.27139  ORF g.27139 m.27139 type:complete len:62 (+) comp6393_c0_seq2:80-265(+)
MLRALRRPPPTITQEILPMEELLMFRQHLVCASVTSLISVESSAWTLVGVWFGGGRDARGI